MHIGTDEKTLLSKTLDNRNITVFVTIGVKGFHVTEELVQFSLLLQAEKLFQVPGLKSSTNIDEASVPLQSASNDPNELPKLEKHS